MNLANLKRAIAIAKRSSATLQEATTLENQLKAMSSVTKADVYRSIGSVTGVATTTVQVLAESSHDGRRLIDDIINELEDTSG